MITINNIRALILGNADVLRDGDAGKNLPCQLELQRPVDVVALGAANDLEAARLLKEAGLTIWIQSGINTQNRVNNEQSIVIDKGLNRFFDIKVGREVELADWVHDPNSPEKVVTPCANQQMIWHRDQFRVESQADIKSWVYQGNKSGGANQPGAHGGLYKREGKVALIKQEIAGNHVKNDSNISEFLASKFFQDIAPGYGAEVHLVRTPDAPSGPDNKGSEIYVASVFFQNYKDLYVDAFDSMGLEVPKERPKAVGTINRQPFLSSLSRDNYKYYEGFEKSMVTSLLFGDFDIHWGNVGVVRNPEEKPKMVRIDFGWAFKGLKNDLSPHSLMEHLPGFGPTNHFREYPCEMKMSPEFIAELRRVAALDVTKTMDSAFDELIQYYGPKPLKDFAISAGVDPKALQDAVTAEDIVIKTKEYLSGVLKSRQAGLELFANELALSACIKKSPDGKMHLDTEAFGEFIKHNSSYARQLYDGTKPIHIRQGERSILAELIEKIAELLGIHPAQKKELLSSIDQELKGQFGFVAKRNTEVQQDTLRSSTTNIAHQ